jgi:hypothetical protein
MNFDNLYFLEKGQYQSFAAIERLQVGQLRIMNEIDLSGGVLKNAVLKNVDFEFKDLSINSLTLTNLANKDGAVAFVTVGSDGSGTLNHNTLELILFSNHFYSLFWNRQWPEHPEYIARAETGFELMAT